MCTNHFFLLQVPVIQDIFAAMVPTRSALVEVTQETREFAHQAITVKNVRMAKMNFQFLN